MKLFFFKGEKMKKTLFMAALLGSGLLFSAEFFKGDTPEAFVRNSALKKTADGLSLKGKTGRLYSRKLLTIDPAKKYRMSLEVRVPGAPVQRIYAGYAPLTGKNRNIHPSSINARSKTDTVLAADAQKGDTVIKVKDAKFWLAKHPYANVAFNTKAKYADLPNNDLAGIKNTVAVKKAGDVWEITLDKPLKKAYAAGTGVRQHFSGGTYIYNIYSAKLNGAQWQTLSADISGCTLSSRSDKKFWPGTEKVQIILITNASAADSVLEIRNFKVEVVE